MFACCHTSLQPNTHNQNDWKHDESIFSDFEILTVTPKSDHLPTYKMLAPFDGIFYVKYPSKFVFCAYYNYTNL